MASSNGTKRMEDLARHLMDASSLDSDGNPVRKRSAQEENTAKLLAALDALGGQTVGDDSLVFTGQKFILPLEMEGDINKAIGFLYDYQQQQETEFSFSRTYSNRPYDGAAAFERAMLRVFGTSGVGKATYGFFGSTPPEYRSIGSGPHSTMQVPWGRVEFSPIGATFVVSSKRTAEHGLVFQLSVEAPRKQRRRIEGFFAVVEDELRNNSIYKGRAITSDGMEPVFIDTSVVDPGKVVYRQDVLAQMEANMWAPVRYTGAMRAAGVPLKRAVLFEGPNGTGKTMAGLLTAQIAEQHGWTFILVRVGEDPLEALKTAQMYAPAVVWVEDLDVIAGAEKNSDRKKISEVLDVLDGMSSKGKEVMLGCTTNFVHLLDKSVLRPGRLDAVIHVAELDAAGYEKVIRALTPEHLLSPDVDMETATAAFTGFLPAFAAEATLRAVRYSIARNAGVAGIITTGDLVDAAHGMQDHLDLMERAQNTGSDTVTMEQLISDTVTGAMTTVEGTLRARGGERMTFALSDGSKVEDDNE